jgi:hypothetical protein
VDRRAEKEQPEIEWQEKALSDYTAQTSGPFEHETRLKELLAKQARLNSLSIVHSLGLPNRRRSLLHSWPL